MHHDTSKTLLHRDLELSTISKFMNDASERFLNVASSHSNPLLVSAVSYEPPPPHHLTSASPAPAQHAVRFESDSDRRSFPPHDNYSIPFSSIIPCNPADPNNAAGPDKRPPTRAPLARLCP
ncbi:hypothetical protein EVAR_39316_1 [Eumeta japonica]|uniref:Uncharacterized protein n=1 Tax=Eumeta variegata TaxID=151549 RepID=A0A4C1VVR3_EUMVA|nr:hypothetical protein EVAR_39316_1 [Eumeta japonica]